MRLKDWPLALERVVDRYAAATFKWGEVDCFTLPMDVVQALTGEDPWADQRSYTTELGAARKLRAKGFVGVGDAFAAKLEEIHPITARRGDIGVALGAQGQECGVVVAGSHILGVSPTGGLTHMPRSRLNRAFKV